MKKFTFVLCFALAVATLLAVQVVHAATLNVCPTGCTYSDIQSAITAASSGDTIAIGAGTYTVTTTMNVTKTLTFQGDGSYPKIFFNFVGTSNIFNVTADNVTFRNLEIYSPISTNGTRSNYAITYTSGSGLLIDDCKFHDLRRALYASVSPGGTTFTVQNSEFSSMNRSMIEATTGTGPFIITRNWIHDSSYLGGSTFGIWIQRDNLAGGVGEISYNYIEGVRSAITYQPLAATAPTSGSLLIAHNTIDNTWTSTTSYYNINVLTSSYNTQGIGIYDPSGYGLNSAAVTIRDNIIENTTSGYGTHYEDDTGTTMGLNGNLAIVHSIYWNNYNGSLTGTFTPNEWFGTSTYPQIGWKNGTGTSTISPDAATKTSDPLFVGGTRTTAASYYALGAGSPACSAASDGQNIGAWQGTCPLPPAFIVAPTVVLNNSSVLNVVAGINTVSGGQVVVGGVTATLSSFTNGDLTGVNLSIPQTIGGAIGCRRKGDTDKFRLC